jgi:CDP-L-myo-inositol myo-inositolphosphotransferase
VRLTTEEDLGVTLEDRMADRIVLLFSHPTTANYLVAGVPAAARATHQVASVYRGALGARRCAIAVPGGWTPTAWCRAELDRLAPNLPLDIVDSELIEHTSGTLYVRGETLASAADIAGAQDDTAPRTSRTADIATDPLAINPERSEAQLLAELRKAGEAIVAATGKASDGIVSKHINRPVSRAISRFALRFPGIDPLHGTSAAAAVGIAMAICLATGGPAGLMAGAVLFQAASIIDGVDGEIARATFRSSERGAMLDSLTDAATNLAFIIGVTFNLWQQGYDQHAIAGVAGTLILAAGMFLLGRFARANGGPFTFDGVKNHFRSQQSRVMRWLTWLTMRDFYAAAAAVLILAGFGPHLLVAFAVVATGWLLVTIAVLSGLRRGACQSKCTG